MAAKAKKKVRKGGRAKKEGAEGATADGAVKAKRKGKKKAAGGEGKAGGKKKGKGGAKGKGAAKGAAPKNVARKLKEISEAKDGKKAKKLHSRTVWEFVLGVASGNMTGARKSAVLLRDAAKATKAKKKAVKKEKKAAKAAAAPAAPVEPASDATMTATPETSES